MKSNNTKCDFVSKYKFIMIVPIVIVLASIIIGAIFGFNFDYDFRNVKSFDVKFNTTITNEEYKELENSLDAIVDKEFDDYRIERIGDGAQNGLLVKIADDHDNYQGRIDTLRETIEEILLDNFSNIATTSVIVTTSETNQILPKNASELILYSAIAALCIMIFAFIYYAIRYNFVSGISIVLTILLEIGMLTSVMIVARVPFNYYFVVSYFVMIISTIFISSYINNQIKSTLTDDKYSNYSNAERIYDAVKKTYFSSLLFMGIVSLGLIAVMFFGNISLVYTIIAILIGNVIALFAGIMFNNTLWAFWYKKDKDASLRRRIESEKKKLENKNDDKIVV